MTDWRAERAANGPVVELVVRTRVPSKWLLVDRETGERWEWREGTWKRSAVTELLEHQLRESE